MECFAFFNLLKFLAALFVAVLLHYNDHFLTYLGLTNPFSEGSFLWQYSIRSYVFVELFFILSGILFIYAYQTKIQKGLSFPKFIWKRYLRIFPLVMFSTIYMYLANLFLSKTTGTLWSCGSLSVKGLLCDMFFAGKSIFHGAKTLNAPVWYVNVLMLCYCISYLLAYVGKKWEHNVLYLLPLSLGIIMRFTNLQYAFWNEDIARGFVAFFTGTILAVLFPFLHKRILCDRRVTYCFRLFFGMLFLITLYIANQYIYPLGQTYFTTFSALLVFPALLFFLYDCKWLNKICAGPLCKWLGAISFDVYIWNFPIYITLHILTVTGIFTILPTSLLFLLFVCLLHIVVAGLSHFLMQLFGKT